MAEWTPMTDEQRQRWKETGLFPVERWGMGQTDATPLVCPLPDRALLRSLAEAIPAHIQCSGWYATGQRHESRTVHSVYGDNFRGMGRQAIASVVSVGGYSGPLADYIAAACPRTVLRLLDRIEELERALGVDSVDGAMAEKYDDVLLPFLSLMRKELHANSRKGDRPGWLAMDPNTALLEVYWHVAKLSAAVKNNDGPAIAEHSADVANMAMMVLDVCGGLAWVEPASDVAQREFTERWARAEAEHPDPWPAVGVRASDAARDAARYRKLRTSIELNPDLMPEELDAKVDAELRAADGVSVPDRQVCSTGPAQGQEE